LVIAAYNCGPTPVQRALEKTGSHSFWDIKEYLPRETQGHVLAFIATASIFENLGKFINLGSIPLDFNFVKETEKEEESPVKDVLLKAKETPSKPVVVSDTKKPTLTEEETKNMVIMRITEPLNIDMTALELGVDKKVLLKMNPDYDTYLLKKSTTPFYNFHLPKDKLDVFLQKKTMLTKKSKIYFAENQL
jgi:membrane-bound lytic murein transglycosylase D